MPRRAASFVPTTHLSHALIEKRGSRRAIDIASEIGIAHTTLLGIERGTHRPSYDTAVALARWLGWTTDEVMKAAMEAHNPVGNSDS